MGLFMHTARTRTRWGHGMAPAASLTRSSSDATLPTSSLALVPARGVRPSDHGAGLRAVLPPVCGAVNALGVRSDSYTLLGICGGAAAQVYTSEGAGRHVRSSAASGQDTNSVHQQVDNKDYGSWQSWETASTPDVTPQQQQPVWWHRGHR